MHQIQFFFLLLFLQLFNVGWLERKDEKIKNLSCFPSDDIIFPIQPSSVTSLTWTRWQESETKNYDNQLGLSEVFSSDMVTG